MKIICLFAKTVTISKKITLTKILLILKKYLWKKLAQSKNNILKSYDLFLNNRYKVVVNEKTLERVKNYFK